jgi:hypothetical protein
VIRQLKAQSRLKTSFGNHSTIRIPRQIHVSFLGALGLVFLSTLVLTEFFALVFKEG